MINRDKIVEVLMDRIHKNGGCYQSDLANILLGYYTGLKKSGLIKVRTTRLGSVDMYSTLLGTETEDGIKYINLGTLIADLVINKKYLEKNDVFYTLGSGSKIYFRKQKIKNLI
jgi:hypothetical protein